MQVSDYSQFRVRLPPDLHEKLKAEAKAGYRSLNSEIVMILEKHFAQREQTKKTEEAQPGSTPSSVSQQ